jgi:hypothetical protein
LRGSTNWRARSQATPAPRSNAAAAATAAMDPQRRTCPLTSASSALRE